MSNEVFKQERDGVSQVKALKVNITESDSPDTNKIGVNIGWKIFYFQKIFPNLSFNDQPNVISLHPSPSDLNNDSTLDSISSQSFSNTSSTEVLSATFTYDAPYVSLAKFVDVITSLKLERTSASGTAYFDSITVKIGKIDSSNNFTELSSLTIAPASPISTTSSLIFSEMAKFSLSETDLGSDRLAVRFSLNGHVDSVTTTAIISILISRGSADTYLFG